MKHSGGPGPIPPAQVYFPEEDLEELGTLVKEILRSGRLTLGPYTEKLEREFASLHKRKIGVAVNSGTSALEILLRALRIRSGEVVVPTNTFAATAFAVLHSGNRLVLGDVNSDMFLDPSAVKQRMTRNTKAVIGVHIGGRVVPAVTSLVDLCQERGVPFIEDAAHAHGSRLGTRSAGSFGIAGAFSFYPTKVMTSAEGGMIVTDDEELAATCRVLRDQGKAGFSQNLHTELGYNWRMSEIHACIGLSQLKRLGEFIDARRRVASIYDRGLEDLQAVQCLKDHDQMFSNYYKYIAFLDSKVSRQELKGKLKAEYGISLSGEVYESPLHDQPVFQDRSVSHRFPVAEDLCKRHICLPVYARMTSEESRFVVDSLHEVLG